MSKNGIFLSVIAVILAAAYAFWFTDWFKKQTIQILPTVRPPRVASARQDPVCPVSFAFDGRYKLTLVKVIAADDLATNKYPTLLWHLLSDSNSVPLKSIDYGRTPKGMRPAVPRTQAEPLQPDVNYVLLLEAGNVKAQTNFHTARAAVSGK